MINPVSPPIRYAGFWIRFAATMIDTLLLLIIILAVFYWVFGEKFFFHDPEVVQSVAYQWMNSLLQYILPIVATLIFWRYHSATPGKMLVRIEIVDVKTLARPSSAQFIIRYLGYFISTIPLCLGFLWIAFDRHKQAWHDKLAGTYVIRKP